MKRRSRFLCCALLVVPLVATWMAVAQDADPKGSVRIGDTVFADHEAFAAAGARCATPVPTDAQRAAVAKAAAARGLQANATGNVIIPIQYIHITNGATGAITEQQRLDQTAVLNEAYNIHGFEFCYDPVAYPPRETSNAAWFTMTPNSLAELRAKTTLGREPKKFLNFYTANPGGGLLGWANFPFPAIDVARDGVVCLHSSLPGGSTARFNLGDTGTHEVGHWLGLFHTFEGGCFGGGDEVADTQAHPDADLGCPSTGPSCNPPASSPVHNFMNYVDDACMDHFTTGQGARARSIVSLFRPQLGSVSTSCGSGGGGCLLARLAGSAKQLLPFPLSQDEMDGLRKFRDGVLNKTEAGRALAKLYYQHGPQMVELMLRDPQLAGETLSFLAKQMPAVERAVERDGAVHLVQKDYDHGMKLLDRYRNAAPTELARTLTHVESLIEEAVHLGSDVVTLKFPSESNIASAALLAPIPDPISTKTN